MKLFVSAELTYEGGARLTYSTLTQYLSKDAELMRILHRGEAEYINTDSITINTTHITASSVRNLTDSINRNGFFDPVVVTDSLSVADGRKRVMAAKLGSVEYIPVTYNTSFPMISLDVISILENAGDYFEYGDILRLLNKEFCISRDTLASYTNLSVSAVSNKIRLSSFLSDERRLILSYSLTERHARALLKLPVSARYEAIKHIGETHMNVSDCEEYIDTLIKSDSPSFSDAVKKIGKTLTSACDVADKYNIRTDLSRHELIDAVVFTFKIYK